MIEMKVCQKKSRPSQTLWRCSDFRRSSDADAFSRCHVSHGERPLLPEPYLLVNPAAPLLGLMVHAYAVAVLLELWAESLEVKTVLLDCSARHSSPWPA